MDDENIKELSVLLKLLRKNGVEYFKNTQIELKLDTSSQVKSSKYKGEPEAETEGLSEDEMLFWSSTAPGAN